jgi:hypothetical protein
VVGRRCRAAHIPEDRCRLGQSGSFALAKLVVVLLLAISASAQTNNVATNQTQSAGRRVENARWECTQSRRIICGKILKVLPDGLVIDSGYTNLMRSPLNRSWLVPGAVEARAAVNLVEDNEPDAVCIGLVFLTDLPKKPVAKAYDYVDLRGYLSGQYIYTSAGDVRRTIRRFSTKLSKAVQWKLDQSLKPIAPLK